MASMSSSTAVLSVRNLSLDGVRGLAVLLVILYHYNYLHLGWMGVDFFFVLSGYLVTTIIRRARADSSFWKDFWVKRATRIFPPLVLILVFSFAYSRFSIAHFFGYLLSFGDVLALSRVPYEPLRPLWSLAVEEHFYLLWPLAIRNLRRRPLIILLTAVIVLEPVLRAIAIIYTRDWNVVYFLTPFRLDGIAMGCLMALLLETEAGKNLVRSASPYGFFLSVATWLALRKFFGLGFTRAEPTAVYSAFCYTLIALIALFGIADLITRPQSIRARLLSWRPLSALGVISYGVYLYHVLIRQILVDSFHLSKIRSILVGIPLVLAFAGVSYTFYERPFIKWGKQIARRNVTDVDQVVESTASSTSRAA